MSDELVAWLRRCLDDDERVAREATPSPWTVHIASDGVVSLDEVDGHMIAEMQQCDYHPDRRQVDGEHIVRNDPARVLAQVAATRRIIAEHRPSVERKSYDEDWTICGTCRYDGGLDTYAFPCPTLRLVALPFADRPGFKPEWAPDAQTT